MAPGVDFIIEVNPETGERLERVSMTPPTRLPFHGYRTGSLPSMPL